MDSLQRIRELCGRAIRATGWEFQMALEELYLSLELLDEERAQKQQEKPAGQQHVDISPEDWLSLREMKHRVLLVDDEANITSLLSVILRSAGFEVRVANSGDEALAITEEFGPDTLITDYAMPGMNGLELADEVVRRFPGCRIILFSGQSHVPAPSLPSYALLSKPVPPRQFLDLLRREAEQTETRASRHARVLYIDDVASHRYSIARMLRLAGFDVEERATGAQALSGAGRHPDLILLDVELPDVDGFEICRIFKANKETAGIPVIHITASHLEERDRRKSIESGAYDYIAEPFDADHLMHRVRSALQLRYLHQSASA